MVSLLQFCFKLYEIFTDVRTWLENILCKISRKSVQNWLRTRRKARAPDNLADFMIVSVKLFRNIMEAGIWFLLEQVGIVMKIAAMTRF